MNRRLTQYLLKHSLLLWLLFGSVVAIVLINFCYANDPEKFEYGYEIGVVVSSLSISYISSFIFFCIIFHSVEGKRLQSWKPIIGEVVKYFGSTYRYANNLAFQLIRIADKRSDLPVTPKDYFDKAVIELDQKFTKAKQLVSLLDLSVDSDLSVNLIRFITHYEELIKVLNFYSHLSNAELENAYFVCESPIVIMSELKKNTDFMSSSYNADFNKSTGIFVDPIVSSNTVVQAWESSPLLGEKIFFTRDECYEKHGKVDTFELSDGNPTLLRRS